MTGNHNVVTLDELKAYFDAQGNADANYLELQRAASSIVETYIDKPIVTRNFVENLDSGGSEVFLRKYPVYKLTSLKYDAERVFAAASVISTNDYDLDSDTGIIELDYSQAKGNRRNQVDYWAGLSRFVLVDEFDNYIDVEETGFSEVAVEIPAGTYNAEDLATAIETALNADAGLLANYTVSYSHETQKFSISASASYHLLWKTGASRLKSLAQTIGFSQTVDLDDDIILVGGALATRTATTAVTGVPADIVNAACQIAFKIFNDSAKGHGALVKTKESSGMPGGIASSQNSIDWDRAAIPDLARIILERHRRQYF